MDSRVWILILVGLLTLLGSAALLFVTVKYYWGERGAPPLEHAEQSPVTPRSPDFLQPNAPQVSTDLRK